MTGMAMARIEPGTLVGEQVFEVIQSAIMNGELEAGSKLRIQDLSAQLGTSHMPIREALRRLEETGLVENPPHRSAVVKELHLGELLHVYSIRRILEVEAARQGAELLTRDDLEKMRVEFGFIREALSEERITDYLDRDERMLSILYASTGNLLLVDMIQGLWNRCRSYKILGARQALTSDDTSMFWTPHEELLAAAEVKDSQAVSRIIDDSLVAAIDRIKARLPHKAATPD